MPDESESPGPQTPEPEDDASRGETPRDDTAEGGAAGSKPARRPTSESARLRRRRRKRKVFRALVRRFFLSRFGVVFAVGVAMVTFWAGLLVVLGRQSPETAKALLSMTGVQPLGGRASAVALGKEMGLSAPTLIFASAYIDITVVFLFFPVIAFGYRNLARLGVFGDFARQAVEAAEESRPRIARWGMVGLFFFVAFPFYMTGPLIGSVIGFFIRLPLLLNLFVVTAGTIAMITLWVMLFGWIHASLKGLGGALGKVMPLMMVVVIVGVAILIRVRSVMKTRNGASGLSGRFPAVDEEEPAEPAEASVEPDAQEGEESG